MTGTALDLTPFGAALQGLGVLYWVLVLVALAVALIKPKRRWVKAVAAAIVLGTMVAPPLYYGVQKQRLIRDALARRDAAYAHFQMRCKDAGERITRTVEGVDGVYLMKLRPERVNYDEQFTPDDVYGFDNGGENYIRSFLRATEGLELDPDRKLPHHRGYAWVEAIDPKDGKLYRYRLRLFRPHERDPKYLETLVDPEFIRQPITQPTARHGVTWEEISTREDREQWVAGGTVSVVDLLANEVIAERRGYMWDRGMGSRSGGRTPWLFAQQDACPHFAVRGESDPRREKTHRENVSFVLSVIKPSAKE